MSLLVNCAKASIRYDMAASPTLMVYPTGGEPYAPELPPEEIGASTEDLGNVKSLGVYLTEIKYFLGCVKAGKQPRTVTLEEARDAVRVCLAATKAAKTSRTVTP
jgi:predicted dehydrogenase